MCIIFFFFFKQKTAYEMRISDWSSDVCSSDLPGPHRLRVSFHGKFADAKDSDPLLGDQYEVTIDKPAHATDVEFIIARESRFGGKPKLTMKQWRSAQ